MKKLSELQTKELILVTGDEADGISDIFATSDQAELQNYLNTVIAGEEIRIIHGIIESAKTLPQSLNNLSAYIVYQDPEDLNSGFVYESQATSISELAVEVIDIIESGMTTSEIEDLYILYGHEIQPRYSIEPEDLDEAVVDSCTRIISEIENTKEMFNKQ